jgi:signal transduction histidine kinase
MYSHVLLEDFGTVLQDHPEAVHYLRRISDNCVRLDRMIQDVLTFGRVTRDGISLEPVSLDKLVTELVHHFPALQPPNADVQIGSLGEVIGHEPSLSQVLSNLLINAVKFVPAGTRPAVHVFSERSNGSVKLCIQDNGIGIDPKCHHRLFGLFERMHPHLGYEGTGVGLAIVRKATLRMGGKVGLESDGTSGSQFWVELPAVK